MFNADFVLLADSLPEPLLVVSRDGAILLANRAACQELGQRQLEGRKLTELGPNDAGALLDYLRLCGRVTQTLPGALRLTTSEGEAVHYRCDGCRLRTEGIVLRLRRSAQQNQFILLAQKLHQLNREIVKRKAMQSRQEQLSNELQRAVRAREDLLAMVSHDLRSPLGVILLKAQLISRAAPPKELGARIRAHAEQIQRAGERMQLLIRDLIDFGTIESGTLRLERKEEAANQIVAQAVESKRPLAAAKDLDLRVSASPQPVPIWGDRHRIMQVLVNLLDNAIKFTAAGGAVVLELRVSDGMAWFSVRDTGAGIAAEDLSQVFERYWRGSKGDHSGTGLGLYIAKALVEAQGGTLRVESALGEGSTFSFSIPLSAGAGPQAR